MAAPRTHAKPAFFTGRPRVQTKWVWGKRERRRWAIFGLKYVIFLALPWIPVGGFPALLFDIPKRQYHVFGQVFWPQDFYMLGLTLAVMAMLLILTTSLVGRIFCGFACPHTLLTSLFMAIDHLIEGDRPVRLAMDGSSPTRPQRLRRAAKHAAWAAVAGFFGFTFVSYFVGAHALLGQIATLTVYPTALAAWAFIAGAVYMTSGHLRDWVCTTVCPYGRFQGAMQDTDSLVVTYDAVRGEPRGKGMEVVARGGCVDCGMCVTACPMGIDVRQGLQYECISCMRCIDACDDTMRRVGAPGGLIRLASQNAYDARVKNPAVVLPPLKHHRWWRPRVGMYAAVLVALLGAIATLALQRPLLGLEVQRDRNRTLTLEDGRVSNLYTLKLINKDTRPHRVGVSLDKLDGRLVTGRSTLTLAPGAIEQLSASVIVRPVGLGGPLPFRFRLVDLDTGAEKDTAAATFVPPVKGAL